jgi:hypothetical protein
LVPVVTARSPDSAAFRTVTWMSDTGLRSSARWEDLARKSGRSHGRLDRNHGVRRDARGFHPAGNDERPPRGGATVDGEEEGWAILGSNQ